jgi:hypothetical protein
VQILVVGAALILMRAPTSARAAVGRIEAVAAPLNAAAPSTTHLLAVADDPHATIDARRAAVAGLAALGNAQARQALEAVGAAIVDGGRTDYEIVRAARRELKKQGVVRSMPPISPKLEAELLAELTARKPDAVIIDWDGTIKPNHAPGDAESTALLGGLVDAGIHTMVLSGRPDVSRRPETPSILDSLAGVSPSVLSRLTTGAKRGAVILRHDADGVPSVVHTAPPWTAAEQSALGEASRRIALKFGETLVKGRSTQERDMTFTQFLRAGLTPSETAAAAVEFEEVMRRNGYEVEVSARPPSSLTSPPSLSVSKLTKVLGVHYFLKKVAETATTYLPSGVAATLRTLLLGDEFFGDRRMDIGMVKGAPGALAISVGGSADPDLDNVFVWRTSGPDGTKQIAAAIAATKRP